MDALGQEHDSKSWPVTSYLSGSLGKRLTNKKKANTILSFLFSMRQENKCRLSLVKTSIEKIIVMYDQFSKS